MVKLMMMLIFIITIVNNNFYHDFNKNTDLDVSFENFSTKYKEELKGL